MIRGIRLRPSEGWLVVLLVLLINVTLAAAVDDAALVLGREEFTDFLLPMAAAGTLIGFIGAKVGWGRWTTYLFGSIFAALIVPMVVGGILVKDAGMSTAMYATADSVVQAVIDLTLRDLSVTRQYLHYLWVLGLLVWATSMFSSSVTFHQRRPLNGIVVVGLVLLINVALTVNEQLPYLVVFSIASLILLVRYHILDEQAEWLRRRIGDPAAISTLYLRGGTLFIVAAVGGSVLLTQAARAKPLEDAWAGFGSSIIEATRGLQRLLPQGGSSRTFGSDFDQNGTSIAGVWNPGSGLEMTIRVATGDKTRYYWRAVTWDEFTGNGWRVSSTPTAIDRESGAALLADTGDAVDPDVARAVRFTIIPGRSNLLFSPLVPAQVDKAATVNVLGDGRRLTAISRRDAGTYTVTAMVPIDGTKAGQRNKSALRAAGTDYPEDIVDLYTQLPDGAIPKGGAAEALLASLVAEVKVDGVLNPFDFAAYVEARFQDSGDTRIFTYDPDILDLLANECRELSSIECFATYKQGFCQHYSTTMAVFLRAEGIPARVVRGFLPGERDIAGEEVITTALSHQWVEVYFPGYGWYTFDPTGGIARVSAAADLPEGDPVPSATPRPSVFPSASIPVERGNDPVTNGRPTGGGGSAGPGLYIAIAALLAAAMGSLAFFAWQRGPRGDTTPERAYRTVTALAARFGFGPRPNQTVYEYATALGDALPVVRPELETVATARVETVYGRTLLGEERLRALRVAERRLRVNLLRLAFRRPKRRRR